MKKQLNRFDAERSPEEVLNGLERANTDQLFVAGSDALFDSGKLYPVPETGVHPRILCSPEQLPDIRRRTKETETGRLLLANLRSRNGATILCDGTWENQVYAALQQDPRAAELLLDNPAYSEEPGHYQPPILYALVLEALDAWISGDETKGRAAASAITGFAELLEPKVRQYRSGIFGGHASRWGSWHALGSYELFGFQHLGYAYDFAHGFMTEEQRATVRKVISSITSGAISFGMELPPDWRNWNWMNCSNCFVLLALAIEGEEGFDARVYHRSVEVMQDYLTYGISVAGSSGEAVGYTAFGWVWGVPAMIAMARRGDNLFLHSHFDRYKHWLLHTMQPYGQEWVSHGDGGDGGPGPHFAQMLKYYYPDDPDMDVLWHHTLFERGKDQRLERMHLVEALLCAADGHSERTKPVQQALTFVDAERGSLVTRDTWSEDGVMLQFECRQDTLTPSHEHADRGNISFTALGVKWVGETFRSVETKYHSCVLIDGKGQGYFPAPGKWLGAQDQPFVTAAACDAKYAYDWFWPKTIAASSTPDDPQFAHERWSSFKDETMKFQQIYGDVHQEPEPSPTIAAHFKPWEGIGPRYWDEDGWPVRVMHNPVQYAYRTAGLVRGSQPYAFIVDDIRKDDQERLYEWTMMASMDIDVCAIRHHDILLFSRSKSGTEPRKGDPMLLVHVLENGTPALARDFETNPAIRLETFEKKDTFNDTHALYKQDGGRSFGLDRRLIIPSHCVEPKFKVLLIPHYHGDELPSITYSTAESEAVLQWKGREDRLSFQKLSGGRSAVTLIRDGQKLLEL
ncbi:hypothetical protein [Paenibacillus sinopodophylli]|uniref:hypothetical protein n=1 Tax=Paenibacillus sinopodophylli TaxID=1837342 RepID=UPI00110D111A|nr:hypothetical protein [Paenibacillus sinopodophylli]